MKNYVKAVLYAYPLLKTVSEDYQAHLENKAALSVRTDKSAMELAVALANAVCEKKNLEWLKGCVENAMDKLTDVEKTLIAVRYFHKKRKIKKSVDAGGRKPTGIAAWSERKYFRFQSRLGDKVGNILKFLGLTEEVFERVFAPMEMFSEIYRRVCERKEASLSQSERRWFGKPDKTDKTPLCARKG